jgi:hypothetical protein
VTRKTDPHNGGHRGEWFILGFNVGCIALAFAIASVNVDALMSAITDDTGININTHELNNELISVKFLVATIGFCLMVGFFYLLSSYLENAPDPTATGQYRVPWVPLTPCVGILINYILIAQQSVMGLMLMIVYFIIATIFYFWYGSRDCEWKSTLALQQQFNSAADNSIELSMKPMHRYTSDKNGKIEHCVHVGEEVALLEQKIEQYEHAHAVDHKHSHYQSISN